MDTEVTSVNQNHAYEETKSSESKRTSRLVLNPKLTGKTRRRVKHSRDRDEQGEDRNQERFGGVMLYSEKHLHEGKFQR